MYNIENLDPEMFNAKLKVIQKVLGYRQRKR
jgi:hypothetical protein